MGTRGKVHPTPGLHEGHTSASLTAEVPPEESEMRKFRVLLDDSRECLNAIRYAAMRASRTGGGVVVLSVIRPDEIQHGFGVADVICLLYTSPSPRD